MKSEIKYFIYAVSLGAGLVAYAHSNFTTKDISQLILSRLNRIEAKIDSLKK